MSSSLSSDNLARSCGKVAPGNPFAEQNRLIARLDMAARSDELRVKIDAAPEWDLVICDEAHRMSASFFNSEVKETQRHKLGKLISGRTRNFLLMSATPHNGYEADFQLFMGLLDADRFEGRFREGVHKADVSDMMRRLTKEELIWFDGTPLFLERRTYTASYELSPDEARLYQDVTIYVREEMNRAWPPAIHRGQGPAFRRARHHHHQERVLPRSTRRSRSSSPSCRSTTLPPSTSRSMSATKRELGSPRPARPSMSTISDDRWPAGLISV